MTDAAIAAEQLESTWWRLAQAWQDVQERWRDVGADRFHAEVMEPLLFEHEAMLAAIETFDPILTRAEDFLRQLSR